MLGIEWGIQVCEKKKGPPPPPHIEGKGREGQRMAIGQWAPPAADENTIPWLLAKTPPHIAGFGVQNCTEIPRMAQWSVC